MASSPFDKPWDRLEAILMQIRDGSNSGILGKPRTRLEAILMQIRDNGGGGGDVPEASTTTSGTVKIDGTSIVMNDGVISVGYANADSTSY